VPVIGVAVPVGPFGRKRACVDVESSRKDDATTLSATDDGRLLSC
jgi:hypothetical protein